MKLARLSALRLIIGSGLVAAAGIATVTTGGTANAAPITSTFNANVTTVIAKMNKTVTFPQATQVSSTDISAKKLTGTMTLPATTLTADLGFATATIGMQLINATPISGTATLQGLNVNLVSQQSFQIRLTSMTLGSGDTGSSGSSGSATGSLGGINLLAGNTTCETPQTTASLTGAVSALAALTNTADFHMNGSYAIPSFTGCGPLTSIINSMVSGSGNTLDVHLTSKTS